MHTEGCTYTAARRMTTIGCRLSVCTINDDLNALENVKKCIGKFSKKKFENKNYRSYIAHF